MDLIIPSEQLQASGSVLPDFLITNIGTDPIKLPASIDGSHTPSQILTLYITSDAIDPSLLLTDPKSGSRFKFVAPQSTSAELYGHANDLHTLAPNESMRVHASSRVALRPGKDEITAHAELLEIVREASSIRPRLIGAADSERVTAALAMPK